MLKQIKTKTKQKNKTLTIVYVAVSVALITICAQIRVPLGSIPFTLQTLSVFVVSGVLGLKRGVMSVLVYSFSGLIGLPVFTGFKGGIGIIFEPTCGYIIGFIFIALIVGYITDLRKKKLWLTALSMVIGMCVCYLFGTIWFMIVTNTGFLESLMMCVVPFALIDLIKIAIASTIVNRIEKIIKL